MNKVQNLFDKYGIKEVADVTFYRIEKKQETYESQRKILASSILKGALNLKTVYPMTDGKGDEEGFEAYVFENADILSGANYDCDDSFDVVETRIFTKQQDNKEALKTIEYTDEDVQKATRITMVDTVEKTIVSQSKIVGYTPAGTFVSIVAYGEPVEKEVADGLSSTKTVYEYTYKAVFNVKYTNTTEGATGMTAGDTPDAKKYPGTHEYSYIEQILMLFAKNQNLITKTGVRYQFSDADTIFGDLEFTDDFAAAPNSTEKVVVCSLPGKVSQFSYDKDDVLEAIEGLNTSYTAKAYDVRYADYAELIVEDEMGYYKPAFLGSTATREYDGSWSMTPFSATDTYLKFAKANKGADMAIANAVMWGDDEHYSINDAIDALKQKKKVLDASEESALKGINSIFGGYKVKSDADPAVGKSDEDTASNKYNYTVGGNKLQDTDGEDIKSTYALNKVLDALTEISYQDSVVGKDLKVNAEGNQSNRAIYVRVDGMVDTAAGAYIYLLHNKNFKRLSTDKSGVFEFEDKKGNHLFYQDKIFAGVEYLALVVIGKKGLIFVVNRHGAKDVEKVAWMINENGYPTNAQCETLVHNGLIHTVDITVEDETFEATCSVKRLRLRKIEKQVLRYVPVLFLDTLKVSTLEQTADNTAATGGRGNSQLIIWDFGKEITLTLQDALYSPASMSAMLGSGGVNFLKGVKDTHKIDRTEKCIAERSFIVPAGNSIGVPSEGDNTPQAVYIDLATMDPYQDGTPIAEGEVYLKWTRSVAYGDNSLGNTIEISADKFPGTYKVVGDTYVRSKDTGEDQHFQFVIPQAKLGSEVSITLEADGEPTVFDMTLSVLRPEDGKMVKLIQYDVVENTEERDGSTMVKDTENLNLLDDAEMYRVNPDAKEDEDAIGATEY